MDRPTLAAYDKDAAAFAKDWHEQPAPVDLHDIVERFFIKGGMTADIGCGSGREVAWLNANGFPAKGFDASEGLLAEARTRYPLFEFAHAELPDLGSITANTYDNVLCETVIMHLPPEQISEAVSQLFGLLIPGGVLALSWRITEDDSRRDDHGRLYSAFDNSSVLDICADYEVLMESENINLSSQKKIHRIVVRKTA